MIKTGQEQDRKKRSLAAIMFTDIVGFTALMGESEEKALRNRRINREIHQQRIEEAGGTWLKEMGDGTMASFASITDALRAAIEIRKICKREMGVELKVGIHFGEVTNEDNDVFGDGVNIASRIEALAGGGGILISESVYRDIKNKSDFKTAFLGETTLKNVEGRHKIYQVLDGDLVKPTVRINTTRKKALLAGMAALLLVLAAVSYFVLWPASAGETNNNASIAVLPFRSVLEDESQKHYGVGLATEIRSKLSQSKHFEFISSMQATMAYGSTDSPSKIGDELEVKYLLSGMYQISGERIKVDVELVDTQSGGIVWNLSFNELLTDIFKLQAEIATKVFNEFAMADNQIGEVPTQNMEAYSHYLRGVDLNNDPSPKTNASGRKLEAEEQLSLAIQKDSSFIDPYVALVQIKAYWLFVRPRWKDREEYASVLKEVMDLGAYSERHFSGSPKHKLVQACIAYYIDRNYDEGQNFFEEFLIYDPENFTAHFLLGAIYKRKLMQKEAIAHLSKASKLDPRQGYIWQEMATVFVTMGDYSSAEKAAHNAIILGLDSGIIKGLYRAQGKISPGLKEKDPVEYYLTKMWFERDFGGIIDMLDTSMAVDSNHKERDGLWVSWMKAQAYYGLGIQDSVRHYGQFFLDNTDGFDPLIHALLGNKEIALKNRREATPNEFKATDRTANSWLKAEEIRLLSILGEYREATELLKTLNQDYPNFGGYAQLFSDPLMDRIKREHPPFVEALNNVKLPPKLDLEGVIKF